MGRNSGRKEEGGERRRRGEMEGKKRHCESRAKFNKPALINQSINQLINQFIHSHDDDDFIILRGLTMSSYDGDLEKKQKRGKENPLCRYRSRACTCRATGSSSRQRAQSSPGPWKRCDGSFLFDTFGRLFTLHQTFFETQKLISARNAVKFRITLKLFFSRRETCSPSGSCATASTRGCPRRYAMISLRI